MNSGELFAPIFFICTYEKDLELECYFNNERYKRNEMYISLLGESDYVRSNTNSIRLEDKIIHDVEKGNAEFGGYRSCASFTYFYQVKQAKPILIPREIQGYAQTLRPYVQMII